MCPDREYQGLKYIAGRINNIKSVQYSHHSHDGCCGYTIVGSVCQLWSVHAAVPTTGCCTERQPLLYIHPPRGALGMYPAVNHCRCIKPVIRGDFFQPFFSLSHQTFYHRRSISPPIQNNNFLSTIFFFFLFAYIMLCM